MQTCSAIVHPSTFRRLFFNFLERVKRATTLEMPKPIQRVGAAANKT